MSGEKPAPTAAEISKARDFLDDCYLDNVLSLEFPCTVDHIRTLLAALDAAEARATAAEFNYCAHDLIVRHFCQMNASLFARLGLPVAELDEMDPPGVEFALTEAILNLQRERDEARAALRPFASFSAGMSRMVPSSTEVLYIDGSKAGLTAGDFRRAAEILKESPRG